MLVDSMRDLGSKVSGRYLLVNIVARRAREIQEMANEAGQVLDKKPVSFAIEEIASGRLQFDMIEK